MSAARDKEDFFSCGCPGCGCLFWILAIVGFLYLIGVLT